MKDERGPILVFGATGKQGGAVVEALLKERWPVRAPVRDTASAKAAALRKAGAHVVEGQFGDTASIRDAFHGVYGVFSVLPGHLEEAEEVRIGCLIADMALESRIAHLVYSSGASVGDKPTGIARFDAKWKIEAHIRSLPLTATIVRPMIFMEMLPSAAFGLNRDRFTFFLRPDQSMQLIAVDDIGRFVAAVFADRSQFDGRTLTIASDSVTGSDLQEIFSEAIGRPITYTRFSPETLAANPSFAAMSASLEDGPLANHADLEGLRRINPGMLSFRSWLKGPGRAILGAAISSQTGS